MREIRYYPKDTYTSAEAETAAEEEFPDAVKITFFDAFERRKAVIELPSKKQPQ